MVSSTHRHLLDTWINSEALRTAGRFGEMSAFQPLVIAHRGNSMVAPENTLAAFEAAWRAGADMIELDIQVSQDGHAVVIHNDTLDQTTSGQGPVSAMPAERIRGLDAGSWFAPAFAGQGVPLFTDVLDFLARREGIDLLLEFKGDWDAVPIARVIEGIEAAGMAERIVVQSFSPTTVAALRDVAPHIPRGLLIVDLANDTLRLCADLQVSQCNPVGELLRHQPDALERMRSVGLASMVWTINEPGHWAALASLLPDGVITDRPDRLRGWLAAQA